MLGEMWPVWIGLLVGVAAGYYLGQRRARRAERSEAAVERPDAADPALSLAAELRRLAKGSMVIRGLAVNPQTADKLREVAGPPEAGTPAPDGSMGGLFGMRLIVSPSVPEDQALVVPLKPYPPPDGDG